MTARRRARSCSGATLPLVHQRRGNDCGPAALAAVVAYHGYAFDHDALGDEIPLDHDGTSLLALARAAERLGFRTHGIKASYDRIRECSLPAIAHLRRRVGGGHFVVVHRWSDAHVLVADPARGLRTLSRKAFCRRSTGYVLMVGPAPWMDEAPVAAGEHRR